MLRWTCVCNTTHPHSAIPSPSSGQFSECLIADTPTTGDTGPLWCYADFRLPYVQRLAELAQPDIIKIDPGEPGSIETTWVDNSIPAITLEIGTPKRWEPHYIQRTEDYIFRLLADLHMVTPSSNPTSNGVEVDLGKTYIATNISSVSTTRTGWVETYVDLLEDVTEGQQIGTVYNSWGDAIENLTSPVGGRVLQLGPIQLPNKGPGCWL